MKQYLVFPAMLIAVISAGQSAKMDFETYNPPSTLVVSGKPVTKSKFPFIDVHNHQFRMPDMELGTLITDKDRQEVKRTGEKKQPLIWKKM
jgi:hypothetical protein